MLTAIPRASRSPPPRWPPSPSNVTRSMASGTTPSHPTSSRHEAAIPRQILTAVAIMSQLRVRSLDASAGCGKVGVERRPADPQPLGYGRHRNSRVLQHRPRDCLIRGVELASPPTFTTASQSCFQALQGALAVEVKKVLGDRAQKVEHQPPRRCLRVHLLG